MTTARSSGSFLSAATMPTASSKSACWPPTCASEFLQARSQPAPTGFMRGRRWNAWSGYGFSRRVRARHRRRRRTPGVRLRPPARQGQGPARCPVAADGDASFPAAGGYSPDNVGHFGLAYEARPISRHRFAAIPTCWFIAPSRQPSKARYEPGGGMRSVFTARKPSVVPTRRRATWSRG